MDLFSGVHYYLSPSFSSQRTAELSHVLDINGATRAESIDDKVLTHFITNTNGFERWQDVAAREEAGQVSVVTDKWVERSVVLGRIQLVSFYSADPAMIFSGIVACATELPATDLEVLSAGISALGGQWRVGLTKDITHLFAISPSGPKYTTALHFQEQTRVRVLLPHWFDDAVRLGIGSLDTSPYEWPEPLVLKGPDAATPAAGEKGGDKEKEKEEAIKKAMRKLDTEKRALYKTASLWRPDDPLPVPPEPSSSTASAASPVDVGTKNVWQGRRVLLSSTLELVGGRREAVEVGIMRAGGVPVKWDEEGLGGGTKGKTREAEVVEQCDVFVTRFRAGKAYAKAVRQAKSIGTLPWMFHVQSTGVLTPPIDQLLWYPIPTKPIEGFTGHEITVTNYTGESREYLKKLIMAMGATFTPSMSGRNTVLIAAYIGGTKTTKAASWSIPIVNHTWLEDCFIKWRNLTVALEKYIVFPPGVDFATMLGERGVGRLVEEMIEEELLAMEEEDNEEEEEAVRGLQHEKNGIIPPAGTENSARDAREVEDAVALDFDGDVDGDVDVEMNMINRDGPKIEHGRHVDRMDVDEVRVPAQKRKRGHEGEDEEEQVQADDEDEAGDDDEDDAVLMRPRKKTTLPPSQTPTQTQRKSLTSRLQEKGVKGAEESTAKTRVKKSKFKEKTQEDRSDRGASEVVRVTKRRSGRIELQMESPRSKGKGRVESEMEMESSSEDDEIEFVEIKTPVGKDKDKGRAAVRSKLVRRVGKKDDFWTEEGDEEGKKTPGRKIGHSDGNEEILVKKMKKMPARAVSSDEEEKVVAKKTKKTPVRKVSSDEDGVVAKKSRRTSPRKAPRNEEEEEEEEEEEAFVMPKVKSKVKKTTTNKMASDEEMEEAMQEEEDEVPVKLRGNRRLSAVAKAKSKAKAIPISDDDEGESEVEPIIYTKPKSRANRKEIDKPKERPKPRPMSKAISIAKAADQTTEPEVEDEDENLLPVKSTKPSGRPSSAIKSKQNESAVSPTKTPKRVVSVLVPPLKLTPKISPQHASTPQTHLTRTESIRLAAGEHPRVSAGRPHAAATISGPKPTAFGPASKTRSKPVTKVVEAESSPAPSVAEDEEVVSVRSKRSAATKATQRLHNEIMPDVMSYQQEMRSKGKGRRSLGGAGDNQANGSVRQKRTSDAGEEEEGVSKKRRRSSAASAKGNIPASEDSSEEDENVVKTSGKTKMKKSVRMAATESEDSDVHIPKTGKPKKGKEKAMDVDSGSSPKKPGVVRLMTTQVTLSEDVLKVLTKLGVKVTTRAAECTHLLAPHLVRTEKFLCALAVAPFILTEKWATDSAAAKTLLEEDEYALHDKSTERKYGFVLDEAVERARELKGGLFANKMFYVTPKVPVDIKLLKNVVTACGGQISTQVPTLRIINTSPDRAVVSCPEDVSIWRSIAKKHPIYTHELLLTAALKQEIEWENDEFRVPGSLDNELD